MDSKQESLKSKIARLRHSFFAELPERLEVIDKDFNQLQLHPNDSKVQKELHRKIHNIKGTTASFGLVSISAIAIQLESLLKSIIEGNTLVEEAIIENFQSLLQHLHSETKETINSNTVENESFPAFELAADCLASTQQQNNLLIFICDDDESLLEYLGVQLDCFAYATKGFTSTASLLKATEEQFPDIIIMDIVFPDGEQTGLECINKIQQLHKKNIPVIFMSARNDFEARLYAVQANGLAYFNKPFKVMELVEIIDSILNPPESEPYRVLVIDDDVKIAEYHSLILQEAGISVKVMNQVNMVLDILNEFKPDLILMDMYMPMCNGSQLAQLIRQIPEFLSLPIVYLSSETDSKNQFSALRVGADGFLTKPIKPERLISEVLLRTERMKVMRSLMVRDSLTGLLNHTTILDSLEMAVISAKRKVDILCFAMIDIDHFKQVNDNYGHAIGDQVILALSRILKQRLRKSDFVGRYGGEEFAVVLPCIDLAAAKIIIDQLRVAFQNVKFSSEQGEFSCSFSGGISQFPECDMVFELINRADSALYQAKTSGRNRIYP